MDHLSLWRNLIATITGMTLPAPRASSPGARRTMLGNRRRDTQPELRLRRLLHSAGLRFRVDYAPDRAQLRRRADIVLTRWRIAVFVDGCFWHGCPEHFIAPKANADYWSEKIQRNRARDRETSARLEAAGWTVLRFWEHQDPEQAAQIVITAVEEERRDVVNRTDHQDSLGTSPSELREPH